MARVILKLRKCIAKFFFSVIDCVRKVLTMFTLFSFAVLFALFFYYLFKGQPFYSLTCVAGMTVFIYLNKQL